MNIIVNVSENWGIGKNNELLFHISADMKFFKEHTTGNTIVMGRKTLESLPGSRALPNRANIVLSRKSDFECENVTVYHSVDELIESIKELDSNSVYVIGGESLYRELLPFCDTAYVTKVEKNVPDADAFMVDLDAHPQWSIESESDSLTSNGLNYKFVTYKRI